VSTPAEIIYEDLRHTALSSETDNIFEIDDPDLRRAEAIKLLVADKREINMTLVALRGIKIASLSKLARHIGAVESEINQALAKDSEKAASHLASIIVETRGSLTYKGASAMINNVNAAAAGRDAEIVAKRKAEDLALIEADRQTKRQALDAELEAKRIALDSALNVYNAGRAGQRGGRCRCAGR
jgi:hypothetical protein